MSIVLARKSVKQSFTLPPLIKPLMESFRLMCNDAIRIGLATETSSLKRLSKLAYGELKGYQKVPSCYKLCAISKAAGILAARKKSIRRGFPTRNPYITKPLLVSCYGFKIPECFASSAYRRASKRARTFEPPYIRRLIATRREGSLFHSHT